MEKYQSQEKYLEVLKTLNTIRIVTYRKMTRFLDRGLQKLFSGFSMDSLTNTSELDTLLSNSGGSLTHHDSFPPISLLKFPVEDSADVFERCREAEWRLLRFYEKLITNPRVPEELRSVLIPQRDKVLNGYEHLNLLSRNPW